MHQTELDELVRAIDVHRAPDASAAARREPDRVADIVDAFADPVDPAIAQRRVDRFRPCHRWMSGAALMKTDEKLVDFGVMCLEPLAKFPCGREEARLHRGGTGS